MSINLKRWGPMISMVLLYTIINICAYIVVWEQTYHNPLVILVVMTVVTAPYLIDMCLSGFILWGILVYFNKKEHNEHKEDKEDKEDWITILSKHSMYYPYVICHILKFIVTGILFYFYTVSVRYHQYVWMLLLVGGFLISVFLVLVVLVISLYELCKLVKLVATSGPRMCGNYEDNELV